MARIKGSEKTGGRKKGSKNKRTSCAVLDGWSDSKGIPYLMSIIEDEKISATLKVDVAKYLIDREKGRPMQPNKHDVSESLAKLLGESWGKEEREQGGGC